MKILILFLLVSCELPAENINTLPGIPNQEGIMIERQGYTVGYDCKWKIPSWVSYHIKREYIVNKVKRYHSFLEDKNLAKNCRAVLKDYVKSGYDRGHMAPAAVMRKSKKIMKESFYLSNMTPQVPGFNRGIWKKLESQVRNLGLITDVWITTGSIMTGTNYIGNKVGVPGYFYKVIYWDKTNATAYILPNKKSGKDPSVYCTSVDEIERLTGYDFLNKLDDCLEDCIESKVIGLK